MWLQKEQGGCGEQEQEVFGEVDGGRFDSAGVEEDEEENQQEG